MFQSFVLKYHAKIFFQKIDYIKKIIKQYQEERINQMKSLVIIGNGFDLGHNLPTSIDNFIKSNSKFEKNIKGSKEKIGMN